MPVSEDGEVGLIDEAHLGRVTMDNRKLALEVVGIFCRQTAQLIEQLRTNPADAPALMHQIKGGAMAIGASRVMDLILAYENKGPGAPFSDAQIADLESEAGAVQRWLQQQAG